MIKRRVKHLIFTYAIVGICMLAFSSCEEDSEIFDTLEIKKETDNENPKGSDIDGN